MTETRDTGVTSGAPAAGVPRQRPTEPERTGWVGWVYFAGWLALLAGIFQGIAGLVALFDEGYYAVTKQGVVVHWTYNEWGWIHLAIGLALLGVGLGLLAGQMWARVVGIAIAGLSAIANFTFLAAQPVWAVVVITIDVFVIYALAVHGREVRA